MGLKARIWTSRLGFVLETGIWASRLEFGPQDWGLRGGTKKEKGEEEEEKEKIPHMCESIGHRPLRGRCPKKERKKQGRIRGYPSYVRMGIALAGPSARQSWIPEVEGSEQAGTFLGLGIGPR